MSDTVRILRNRDARQGEKMLELVHIEATKNVVHLWWPGVGDVSFDLKTGQGDKKLAPSWWVAKEDLERLRK